MAWVLVASEVEDYELWRKVYDDMGEVRTQFGITDARVLRDLDQPSQMRILLEGSREDLEKYAKSHELYEAMKSASVVGIPHMTYLEDLT